jgi:hypothetical protein
MAMAQYPSASLVVGWTQSYRSFPLFTCPNFNRCERASRCAALRRELAVGKGSMVQSFYLGLTILSVVLLGLASFAAVNLPFLF